MATEQTDKLATVTVTGGALAPKRDLTPEDLTDRQIPALHRATILRVPQAAELALALQEIKGRPLGERILVLPLPPDERFGQVIIPENAREDQQSGIVVAVGRGRYENGVLVPPEVRPGNFVTFSKYSARKIDVGGAEVYQIAEQDITFAAGE